MTDAAQLDLAEATRAPEGAEHGPVVDLSATTAAVPGPSTSLGEARAWLRKRVGEGERCPCCQQFAKVYKRSINSSMARALVTMYRVAGTDWVKMSDALGAGKVDRADEAKLRYWKLIEEEPELRPDGGRAGWWRVTDLGRQFVLGTVTVPKYAHVYDGRCLGLEGAPVRIEEALGNRFDLSELMALRGCTSGAL